MLTTNNENILFDDVAEIDNKLGENYSVATQSLSTDCDCTSYTEPLNAYGDCSN